MKLQTFVITLLISLFVSTKFSQARQPTRAPATTTANSNDWSVSMLMDGSVKDKACTGYSERNKCQVICLEKADETKSCMRDLLPKGSSIENHTKAVMEKITETQLAMKRLGNFELPDKGSSFTAFANRIKSEEQKKCNAPGANCGPTEDPYANQVHSKDPRVEQ